VYLGGLGDAFIIEAGTPLTSTLALHNPDGTPIHMTLEYVHSSLQLTIYDGNSNDSHAPVLANVTAGVAAHAPRVVVSTSCEYPASATPLVCPLPFVGPC
jgi:hypothetical protein